MHTHIGALLAVPAFLAVLLCGTAWRLIAAHMTNASNSTLAHVGKAMAFQY